MIDLAIAQGDWIYQYLVKIFCKRLREYPAKSVIAETFNCDRCRNSANFCASLAFRSDELSIYFITTR